MRHPNLCKQIGAFAAGREANVLGDRHVRKEAVLLWQVPHAALFRAHDQTAAGIEPGLIAGGDPALGGPLEPGDGAQQ